MMNMKLLAVVTSPSIYHGCSTRKKFWEVKITGEENFTLGAFTAVNTTNCGRRNGWKHKEIKGSDNCFTLDILLNYDSLDKMRIIFQSQKLI